MKDLRDISNVYFVGIGGIGMSALAHYFVLKGKTVAGYDKTRTSLTQSLEQKGIAIHYEDGADLIPEIFRDQDRTLIIYTPAIPPTHTELQFFRQEGFTVLKRAEVLGKISEGMVTLAVAGTHGKTTTSTILAYILHQCNEPLTAFLGGISENFDSNFISTGEDVLVVEADEFDRSFLQLRPDFAAITSMDADHLDIYETSGALQETFSDFAQLVKSDVFLGEGLPLRGKTYGFGEQADVRIEHIEVTDGQYKFAVITEDDCAEGTFSLPGKHNLMNALAAVSLANAYGVKLQEAVSALEGFQGVDRRFSYRIRTEELVLIDDYAHHPTELEALHQAVREMYPNDQVMIVFQPHLYSRTRDFHKDFAKSLSAFDAVRLMDIYPAREEPIPGITSEALLHEIDCKDKSMLTKRDLSKCVQEHSARIKLIVGAGDIGEEVKNIVNFILKMSQV